MSAGNEYTLAELEPGWTEESHERRSKTSMRMHGSMRMQLRRVGRTPENSRHYVPGDPVHLIDWKAFARTDEVIIREQRDEASAQVAIVIDFGESMHWPDAAENPGKISKFEIAMRTAMWLAHTHLVMGDAVQCWLRQSDAVPSLRWTPRSPADVMAVYAAIQNQFSTRVLDFFLAHPWLGRKTDTLWLLTDALETWNISEIALSSKRVMFAHILSSLECSVDWMDNDTCYVERTPRRKDYMGMQLKAGKSFEHAVNQWRETWQKQVRKWGGSYFLATDTTAVSSFFHWVTAVDER